MRTTTSRPSGTTGTTNLAYTHSPASLTLLKRYGYIAETVEKWIHYTNRRKDLFGFLDILAYRTPLLTDAHLLNPDCPTTGMLGVQACSEAALSAHIQKVTATPEVGDRLRDYLLCGNRYELWGFPRPGRRRLVAVRDPSGRTINQTRIRFIKLTYEDDNFFQDETTELVFYGYCLPVKP